MPLDPKAEMLLRQLAELEGPPLHTLGPAQARQLFHESTLRMQAGPVAVEKTWDLRIPGPYREIPVRVYRPSGTAPLPVLVYYHGGGWVIGDLDGYDDVCCRLADAAGCLVVSVDYGLAPEHKFPQPVEEAYAALSWVADHAEDIGGDKDRLAVGGDSAGGNLSAVVSLLARDRGGPSLRMQVLIYPATDLASETASRQEYSHGFFLEEADMQWFGRCYLRSSEDVFNPLVSPLRAKNHAGLPPAFVITAEYDPLHDEGVAYAERLRACGVPVEHHDYSGMIHGFVSMSGIFEQAQQALAAAGAALHKAFA
jgi:acetyl esterase